MSPISLMTTRLLLKKAARMSLRIGVVQLNPKIGQVQANIKRARELCSKLLPKSLDLLCFPEMAFSGYVFENASAIKPFLEEPRVGPTSQFCAELAKTLNCYVVAGYPEKLSAKENKPPLADPSGSAVGANSAVLYDPQGEWVGGYRKTNLYDTDMTWAKAGTGFTSFILPPPFQTLSLAICMDLNARPETPWVSLEVGPYEVAKYCLENKTKVLVLLNAWLLSDEPQAEGDDGVNDWNTLQYWANRLRPLWAKNTKSSGPSAASMDAQEHDETIVIVCNRSGTENGITFAGTSSIFSMVRNAGRPKLLDMMGKDEEAIRVWNISI